MKKIVVRNKEDYTKNTNDGILKQSFNIYVRVSTLQQIENTSLDNQTELGLQFCNSQFKNKFKYVIVWREEGKSGDDHSDDGVSEIVRRELLSIITKKWESKTIKNLWIFDLSRLSRNDDSSNLLKGLIYKNGIDLYVNNQKYDFDNKMDRLLFGVLSIVNEFENHQRFEKGVMGKLKILEDNKHWGGVVPFGYEKDENGRLVQHPFTSKMVKMIFTQYSKGSSIKKICKKLEELNVWTQRGNKKWSHGSVLLILKNELYYTGKQKYEVKLLKGKSKQYCREKGQLVEKIIEFEPIVHKELFDKVQKQVQSLKRKPSKVLKPTLLRDILFCGNCGTRYYGKINEKVHINIYHCTHSSKKYKNESFYCNNNRSINIRLTDDLVWSQILDVFYNSERVRNQFREENFPKELSDPKLLKKRISNIENKISRRRNKVTELNNRKSELYENYLSLKINKNTLDRLMTVSEDSISTVNEEIKSLESEIQIIKGGLEWEDWFEDFEKFTDDIKSYTSIEQKRKFIESIVEKIIVTWDGITNTHNLKIKFKFHIVKDRGKEIGNYKFELKKGKNTLETNKLDFQKIWLKYRKVLGKNPINENHSTVTDFAKFLGWSTLQPRCTAI